MSSPASHTLSTRAGLLILVCALYLAIFTVYYQINFMGYQGGLAWYERVQWERTQQVMHGEQGTPWQYRLFTDTIVYATVRGFEASGVPRPIGTAFVLIRLLQNVLLFTLAAVWYHRLGATLLAALFGVGLLAWGMCHGLYDGDLTFNTYTDLSIFLGAALLIQAGRFGWLVPLMVAAAFNRETSGCIPFMLLFSQWRWKPSPGVPARVWKFFFVTIGIYFIIVGGMRLPFLFGMRPYIVPTAGVEPILPLLLFNLTWYRTWVFLFAVVGLLPILAFISWKAWPPILQRIALAVVPVWFPIHFMLAHAPETRLFFVPHALVFVPGALLGIWHWQRREMKSP
jgi:hypothetical protein